MQLPEDPCPSLTGYNGRASYQVVYEELPSTQLAPELLIQRLFEKCLHNTERVSIANGNKLSESELQGVFATHLRKETDTLAGVATHVLHPGFRAWLLSKDGLRNHRLWNILIQNPKKVDEDALQLPRITSSDGQYRRFTLSLLRTCLTEANKHYPRIKPPEEQAK